MENIQPSANQNPEVTARQQASSNNSKLLLTVIFSVLLTAVIAGSTVYFWQKSTNEKAISDLEKKISSFEKQISSMERADTSFPVSGNQIAPTLDDETNWKTYTNADAGFVLKYPLGWYFEENVNYIGPSRLNYTFFYKEKVEFMPGIYLWVVSKVLPRQWIDATAFDEFAQVEQVTVGDNIRATRVSGIPGALEQEWVFVDRGRQTVILHVQSSQDEVKVFNQILSTLLFTD